ncbi:uncharacterized protein N7511_000837 [Penicillium nucicola]|uniref:uncharacterized protein n=1 Tax=Penicillium nucicola TaxID=1850975 RepID=UPI002544F189|nr:uncharacterized protein N7511_000837 [Penicillium nucicola]KAJ5775826.1 hypothetical protein N7511_000837 [Penicillium nucicola]
MKPRRYRNDIACIFELVMTDSHFYQLAEMLLGGLTATEISLVAHLLGITDSFLYANKYLNPLRELDPFMVYFLPLIQQGNRLLILGDGLVALMERIQSPATYWGNPVAAPPEIWIAAISPTEPHHEASEASHDYLIHPAESKYLSRDPDTSMPTTRSKDTSLFLRPRHPKIESQWSKYMCTVGSCSFEIDWNDLYSDIQPTSTLPYIDATEEPHKIKFSRADATLEFKSDIHNEDRSMVLWKKKHSLASNHLFTGRALDEIGRNILDEVKFSFKFPFGG